MEREVASTVHLAVTLVLLAVVLSLVVFTVYVGNSAKEKAIDKAADVQVKMDDGELDSLSNYGAVGTTMPKASIYYIVCKGYSNIGELDYNWNMYTYDANSNLWSCDHGERFEEPGDIIQYYGLNGKANVVVTTVNGKYIIQINDSN